MSTGPSHSEFKLQFKIAQQPDGTFLGVSEQPHLEIRGATHDEVLKKIQDSLGSQIMQKLGLDLSAELTGSGVQVKLNKRVSITRKNADGTVEMLRPAGDAPEETPTTMPVTAAPIDAPGPGAELLKSVIGLLVLIALAWWFFHR